jgi:hypothetical protein
VRKTKLGVLAAVLLSGSMAHADGLPTCGVRVVSTAGGVSPQMAFYDRESTRRISRRLPTILNDVCLGLLPGSRRSALDR